VTSTSFRVKEDVKIEQHQTKIEKGGKRSEGEEAPKEGRKKIEKE
jgi:hypothetical protein